MSESSTPLHSPNLTASPPFLTNQPPIIKHTHNHNTQTTLPFLTHHHSVHSLIRSKADDIFHRFAEIKNRAEAVEKARKLLRDVKNAVSTWAEKLPHITQDEKDKLLEAVAKADSWLSEKEELQVRGLN